MSPSFTDRALLIPRYVRATFPSPPVTAITSAAVFWPLRSILELEDVSCAQTRTSHRHDCRWTIMACGYFADGQKYKGSFAVIWPSASCSSAFAEVESNVCRTGSPTPAPGEAQAASPGEHSTSGRRAFALLGPAFCIENESGAPLAAQSKLIANSFKVMPFARQAQMALLRWMFAARGPRLRSVGGAALHGICASPWRNLSDG